MSDTWQNISKKRGIPLNDQFFLVYCETKEKMYGFERTLKERYGFEFIRAYSGGLLVGPWMYVNLNTGFMFYGNVGADIISGPVIGDHALTMEEFILIADIYQKYRGFSLLVFSEEGQKRKEESDRKAREYKAPSYHTARSETIEEYRNNVRKCLLERCNEAETDDYLELYDDYLERFYSDYKWDPITAASAIMFGF